MHYTTRGFRAKVARYVTTYLGTITRKPRVLFAPKSQIYITTTIVYTGYILTSLQTSMVPNTTWRPSKKLSPMMMTVVPPVVQPSLGHMALMVGVAAHRKPALLPYRSKGKFHTDNECKEAAQWRGRRVTMLRMATKL